MHITLSGGYAAAEHLWLRLSCSDSNFTGYLEVTPDLNCCPQRITYSPVPQIMSQLLFLSIVDVLECSEEAVDALQISYHTSHTDTQTPVQPTGDAYIECQEKANKSGTKSCLQTRFFPPLHAYLLDLVTRWSDGKREIMN